MNEKYEALRAAIAAGPTAGEWEANEYGVGEFWVSAGDGDEAVAVCMIDTDIRYAVPGLDQQKIDCHYIASASPAIVSGLMAVYDAAETIVEIDDADAKTDPDRAATDEYRASAWANLRAALAKARGES